MQLNILKKKKESSMEEIVNKLIKLNKTISAMESCTGGLVTSTLTNIKHDDDVFRFSAVTYSNDFKIKMGVSEDVINIFGVYSMETANEMSQKIAEFTNSDYGIGITGKLNDKDKKSRKDNTVYISIYDRSNQKFYNEVTQVFEEGRANNKEVVVNEIIKLLKGILDC